MKVIVKEATTIKYHLKTLDPAKFKNQVQRPQLKLKL